MNFWIDKFKFLPLLVLYIIIILALASNSVESDEGRYILFANNMANGFYTSRSDINLWNGPGYPIILLPFAFLNLPWLTAKILNAIFLFIAILYFYYGASIYIERRVALVFSYLLGLYPLFIRNIHQLLPETVGIFLVCGFLFHFCKLHRVNKNYWLHLIASSFYLGYLALTKIFFGYVIIAGLILSLILYLCKKSLIRRSLLTYSFSFLLCLPWLGYTYSLTGKPLYWGNSGGSVLYWMSTPYENEFGDWQHPEAVLSKNYIPQRHKELFNRISVLSGIQRDDILKKEAIHNIISNPAKFFKNWLANVGRLLFNYPYSYTSQKLSTLFYIIPNMFIIVFSILCIYPTYIRRKLVPYEIYSLLLFGIIIFGGSSFLSAYERQFRPVVPILMLWISFTLNKIVKIKIAN
jgi:hypothetical protein